MRRSIGQVRLIGAEDGTGRTELFDAPQFPVTLELTLGALPGPWETACVVRVHVSLPLLYETIVVLLMPSGALPNEAT